MTVKTVHLAVLLALLGVACGYTLAGRGSFLPPYIQTIGVPLFANETTAFQVEQVLTEKVRAEFIGRGKYRVLPEATGADAVLEGEIGSIGVQPLSFTEQQQASRYVLIVTMKITLRDLKADRVIWENPSLVFREEYEVATGGGALDPTTFFMQDTNAMERVATDFAKSVVSAILEAF